MPKVPSELSGFPISEIARICGVSLKTASRWKDGQNVPPKTALLILAGDLGCFSPVWAGWEVRGEELISPEGWIITRNDVLSAPLLRAQLSTYQAELRRMKEDAEEYVEDQPEPGSWDVQIA